MLLPLDWTEPPTVLPQQIKQCVVALNGSADGILLSLATAAKNSQQIPMRAVLFNCKQDEQQVTDAAPERTCQRGWLTRQFSLENDIHEPTGTPYWQCLINTSYLQVPSPMKPSLPSAMHVSHHMDIWLRWGLGIGPLGDPSACSTMLEDVAMNRLEVVMKPRDTAAAPASVAIRLPTMSLAYVQRLFLLSFLATSESDGSVTIDGTMKDCTLWWSEQCILGPGFDTRLSSMWPHPLTFKVCLRDEEDERSSQTEQLELHVGATRTFTVRLDESCKGRPLCLATEATWPLDCKSSELRVHSPSEIATDDTDDGRTKEVCTSSLGSFEGEAETPSTSTPSAAKSLRVRPRLLLRRRRQAVLASQPTRQAIRPRQTPTILRRATSPRAPQLASAQPAAPRGVPESPKDDVLGRCRSAECSNRTGDRYVRTSDPRVILECSHRCRFWQHAVCFRRQMKDYHPLIDSRSCVTPDCNGYLLRTTLLDPDGTPVKKYVDYKTALEDYRQIIAEARKEVTPPTPMRAPRSRQTKGSSLSADRTPIPVPRGKVGSMLPGSRSRLCGSTRKYLTTLAAKLPSTPGKGASSSSSKPTSSEETSPPCVGLSPPASVQPTTAPVYPSALACRDGGDSSSAQRPMSSTASAPCFAPPSPLLLMLLSGALSPSALRSLPLIRDVATAHLSALVSAVEAPPATKQRSSKDASMRQTISAVAIALHQTYAASSKDDPDTSLNPEATPFVPQQARKNSLERRNLLPDIAESLLQSRQAISLALTPSSASSSSKPRQSRDARPSNRSTQMRSLPPAVIRRSQSVADPDTSGGGGTVQVLQHFHPAASTSSGAELTPAPDDSPRKPSSSEPLRPWSASGDQVGRPPAVSHVNAKQQQSEKTRYRARVVPAYSRRDATYRKLRRQAESRLRQQRKSESVSLQQLALTSFTQQQAASRSRSRKAAAAARRPPAAPQRFNYGFAHPAAESTFFLDDASRPWLMKRPYPRPDTYDLPPPWSSADAFASSQWRGELWCEADYHFPDATDDMVWWHSPYRGMRIKPEVPEDDGMII